MRFLIKPSACLCLVLALGLCKAAPAQDPQPAAPPEMKPWFVDDEKLFADFKEKLIALAKEGKCLANEELTAKLKSGTKAKLRPAKAGAAILSPEEVYRAALPSVFIIGSVHKNKEKDKEKDKDKEEKDKEEEWHDGLYATAWVAGEDGVLVTNWHVFEELEESEVFGAVDYKGRVYPVVEFLGGDKLADVAIVRIAADGLKPLPVAESYPAIGSWVGVLGHPGDNYFVYTQGFITRYSTNKNESGKHEKWMGLTAEYAGGSSGSPVLNDRGAVVGMAALTLTIDGTPGAATPNRRNSLRSQPPEIAPQPREKLDPKEALKLGAGSSVQMILKMAVPGPVILKSFAK
jgi:S1-C subfamily serine protease